MASVSIRSRTFTGFSYCAQKLYMQLRDANSSADFGAQKGHGMP